jgi:hypothetical protein
MIKGSLSYSQPDEVEIRIAVPLDTILALASGDKDGYLKISKATFLALLDKANSDSDANHNIAQILLNFSKGGQTDVGLLV